MLAFRRMSARTRACFATSSLRREAGSQAPCSLGLKADTVARVASGQAMLAIYQGTAFDVSYVLLGVAPLIISIVMLRSNVFGKVTAYVGIVANVLAVGFFVPAIGVFLSLVSVVGLLIWYILIARRLFLLTQGVSKKEANQH
jgi:hypothetical protein